jgi:hypothetical protein
MTALAAILYAPEFLLEAWVWWPMTGDYLPAGGPNPEDFFRTLAAGALPTPDSSDLGWVFVSAVNKSEDCRCRPE